MANVQLENGYTRLANQILDQLIIRNFSIKQINIINFIIRFSYGFQRKYVKVDKQSIFELSGVYRCDIKRELKNLEQNKVIFWNSEKHTITFNKNYDEWKIPFHKLYEKNKYDELIKSCLSTTNKDVCGEQTDVFAENKQVEPEKPDTKQEKAHPKEIERNIKEKNHIKENFIKILSSVNFQTYGSTKEKVSSEIYRLIESSFPDKEFNFLLLANKIKASSGFKTSRNPQQYALSVVSSGEFWEKTYKEQYKQKQEQVPQYKVYTSDNTELYE